MHKKLSLRYPAFGSEAEAFYGSLQGAVRVGIEASGPIDLLLSKPES